MGASYCPWGGHTDWNGCNIHGEVRRSIGWSRRGGYTWTDGRMDGRKESQTIIMDSLEYKTPVLLSKQGFGMRSYFRRGLTLEQPNDRVLHSLRKKFCLKIYIHAHWLQSGPVIWKLPGMWMILMGSYFWRSKYCMGHGVLLSKGSYFKGGSYFRDYTVFSFLSKGSSNEKCNLMLKWAHLLLDDSALYYLTLIVQNMAGKIFVHACHILIWWFYV